MQGTKTIQDERILADLGDPEAGCPCGNTGSPNSDPEWLAELLATPDDVPVRGRDLPDTFGTDGLCWDCRTLAHLSPGPHGQFARRVIYLREQPDYHRRAASAYTRCRAQQEREDAAAERIAVRRAIQDAAAARAAAEAAKPHHELRRRARTSAAARRQWLAMQYQPYRARPGQSRARRRKARRSSERLSA